MEIEEEIMRRVGCLRPGQGYLISYGPGNSVSSVEQITASHPIFDNTRYLLMPPFMFDNSPAAGASHGDAHRPRSDKRSRAAASEEAILGLQEVTGRSRSGEDCAVCLQEFGADETLRAMPCFRAFHHHCLSQWLRRKAICPLCRHRLPKEEDDEEGRKRRGILRLPEDSSLAAADCGRPDCSLPAKSSKV